MRKAWMSLGSNLGDKLNHLIQAVDRLNAVEGLTVVAKSSFYSTTPVGYLDQDDFVNAAIRVETSLSPEALLSACQKIELELKRERVVHWGPRTIDIDILLIEGYASCTPELVVPHPRMTERAFVMVPLVEIDEQVIVNGKSAIEWLTQLDCDDIRKMTDEKW